MKLLWTIVLLLFCTVGFAQSERHDDYYTRDTLIHEKANGEGPFSWWVRITTHRNDPTKRPSLFNHNGAGEIGNDTTFFVYPSVHSFGPHYFMSLPTPWDGGIKLGNGTHYPNYFTIMPPVVNMRGWHVLALMDTLIKYYPIDTTSMHFMGLSMGSQEWQYMMMYYPTNTGNDEPGMRMMKSFVDLEGEGGEQFAPFIYGPAYPTALGHWAKKYGGKMFGLEGSQDSRNIWQLTQNIRDSTGTAGYFSYENYGGGGHCCWNSMYDPSVVNWRSIPTITNSNLVYSTNPQSTMGNYYVDAANGSNIFQWMLRQGDTTLYGTCNPIVSAGSNQSFFLPTNSCTLTGSVTLQCGHVGSTVLWTKTSGPNTPTIVSSTSTTTSVTGLIAGVYVFNLTATDTASLTGSSTVQITVNAEIPPTVGAGGPYFVVLPTSSVTVSGTATGNGGATISSVGWTYISGPGGSTIVSASSNSTIITGLTAGTYIFQFTATDNNGNSSNSNATVIVNTGGAPGTKQILHIGEYVTPWIDSAGNARTLTSSVSLMGTGNVGTPGLPGIISTPGFTFNACDNILHGVVFKAVQDSSVWTAGGNDMGQCGIGSYSGTVVSLTKILTDSNGRTFKGVKIIQGWYSHNSSEGLFMVKAGPVTDSIFNTGDRRWGMAMNGTLGDSVNKPTLAYYRTGHHIVEMAASKAYAILFDDGQVWTGGGQGIYSFLGYAGSGNQYLTPHQVTGFDDSIRHIVGGDVCGFLCLSKTGKLYGFGPHSGYLGNASDIAYTTPRDLTDSISSYILNGTTRTSIAAISANSNSFHILANDSTQWGWGDNGQGSVGNGVEVNMPTYTTPWSVDPAQILVLPQTHPIRVTNKHNFIKIFSGCLFGFAHFSLDINGQLYANGRNKGAILGNGVVECAGANGDINANYSNSWDLPYITPINPYGLTINIKASCPGCKTSVVTAYCSECTIPTTTPTANGGGNQTLPNGTASTTLNALGSTSTGGAITYYLWTQTGGAAATIDVPASPVVNVSGLTPGIYTFNLKVTDNGFNTSNQTVTVMVSSLIPDTNYFIRKRYLKVKFN